MQIKTSLANERGVQYCMVEVSGRMSRGPESQQFRAVMESLVKQGATHFILDMGAVVYIDSTGLSELIGFYSVMYSLGGSVRLARVGEKLTRLLDRTKLSATVFKCFGTVEEAKDDLLKFLRLL